MVWAPDYATVAELRKFVRIPVEDTVDDAELGFAVSAASRAVDLHTHRQFGLVAAPETRYYPAEWDRRLARWVIDIDDLQTATGLVVNADLDGDETYDDVIDEVAMRPVNAAKKDRPWTRLVVLPASANQPSGKDPLVEVTASFGWSAVPDAIKEATLLQANRFHARRFSPYGVAGSPDTGSELRLLNRVDPDVAVSLGPFIRWWAAA